jgi:IS1 family transposase
MNVLPKEKQAAVLRALVDGVGIRATARVTGVNRETVGTILTRAGASCAKILDETMRNLPCERLQVDEIWSFVGKKERHVRPTENPNKVGDFWTWLAIDADTKLIPAHRVGKRSSDDADAFMADLAGRLRNRVQISSDGLAAYVTAVHRAFGLDVDFGQIVKVFTADPDKAGRYSPPAVAAVSRERRIGWPKWKEISTSYAERANLTLRMASRRFTRLTNAFSKKVENLRAAVALHLGHYNLARPHMSLDGRTPAMRAGVASRVWDVLELMG